MAWSGGFVEWVNKDNAYISVVFSWQLSPDAYQRAVWYRQLGYNVHVGGPAVSYNRNYLSDVADTNGSCPALKLHNPDATFTSRGCVRNCNFCIVPKIEPEYIELNDWDVRPIVCDNNFLASSNKHFNSVVDKLKSLRKVDFNQGLDARLMTQEKANRLSELDMKVVRLAWDHTGIERQFLSAFQMIINSGIPRTKIQSYVLIGFNDTPEDALYRLETIRKLGAMPNPMRYQPLNSTKRNSYVGKYWTDRELKDYMRYWSRQIWLRHIPFADYVSSHGEVQ